MNKTDILNGLMEYFNNTPREQVLEDWKQYEKWDEIGPSAQDFIDTTKSFMRKLPEVIEQMIVHIPEEQGSLIKGLEKISKDCAFTAPEDYIRWFQVSELLEDEIGTPVEDWHFEIASIFTAISVEDLKKELNEDNKLVSGN